MKTPDFSEEAVARFLIFLILASLIVFAVRVVLNAPAREEVFVEAAEPNQSR